MMISPHTAPGTLVVFRPMGKIGDSCRHLPVLKAGGVYTVESIEDCINWRSQSKGFGVALVETSAAHRELHFDWPKLWEGRYEWFYDIEDFELAQLPRSLTEILERAPAPKRKVVTQSASCSPSTPAGSPR